MADRKEIDKFLLDLKLAIKSELKIIYTKKNRCYIKKQCITEKIITDVLSSLVYRDYSSGPEVDYDHNRSGDIWIFGKEIKNEQIYIKLKVESKEVKCLSFHPAEGRLILPFKNL